jgi:hypothetical protein
MLNFLFESSNFDGKSRLHNLQNGLFELPGLPYLNATLIPSLVHWYIVVIFKMMIISYKTSYEPIHLVLVYLCKLCGQLKYCQTCEQRRPLGPKIRYWQLLMKSGGHSVNAIKIMVILGKWSLFEGGR